jgi:hypothetical protein
MDAARLKRELAITGTLLGFGLLLLPLAIYWVGQQVVGEYAPGADALNLASELWLALWRGNFAAWTLVLSPLLVVQLLRLARWIWRVNRL